MKHQTSTTGAALGKEAVFQALDSIGPDTVKVPEAEAPKQSDRERRSIQDDLEAAFGGTDISLHGDLGEPVHKTMIVRLLEACMEGAAIGH